MRPTIPLQAAEYNSVRQLERNGRKIYMPAELSINPERLMRTKAIQDGQSKKSKLEPDIGSKNSSSNHGFNPVKTCYLPLLQESATTREIREQKAKNDLIAAHGTFRNQKSGFQQHRRVLSSEEIRLKDSEIAHAKLLKDEKATSAIMMELECHDIETLRTVFERKGHLIQEEFVKEMLRVLPSSRTNTPEIKIEVTMQLCALFRRADVQDKGELTWNDFCSYIARNSDEMYSTEGKAVNEYGIEDSPPPINLFSEVNGLLFIPEVDHLVVSSDSKAKYTFQVFEASTNKLVFDVKEPKNADVLDALYLPNQRFLVAATSLSLISFYDTNHYRVRQQIPTECVQTALVANQKGTNLFSASFDGFVHLWNLETLTKRHSFFQKNFPAGNEFMTDLAYIESIEQIGCGSINGHIYMVDVQTSRTIKTLVGHKKGISALKYCQEYGYLISGGIDHCVQVWNPHLEQTIGSFHGHRSEIIGIEMVEHLPEVITADASGVIKIWDLRKFAAVQTIVKEVYVKQQHYHCNSNLQNSSFSTKSKTHFNGNTFSNNGNGTREGRMQGMRAICYMSSRQRLAIGDHSVYFLDAINGSQYSSSTSSSTSSSSIVTPQRILQNQIALSKEDTNVERNETNLLNNTNIQALEDSINAAITSSTTCITADINYKTLQVLYNVPCACFVSFTAKHINFWDAMSGKNVRYFDNLFSPCEITCACDVDGGYSYVIGTYEGKLFRIIMPSGSIMLEKQVHRAQVTAVKPFIKENRRLVVSSSFDGNIIISTFETLENIKVFNHWRGIQNDFGLVLAPPSVCVSNSGSTPISTFIFPTKGRRNSSLPEAQRWRKRVSNMKSLSNETNASTTATCVSVICGDDTAVIDTDNNMTTIKEAESHEDSIPTSARSLFVDDKEFDRFKQIFSTFDAQAKGFIPANELPLLLEKAFPRRSSSTMNELVSAISQSSKEHPKKSVWNLSEIVELLHEGIHKRQKEEKKRSKMAEISTIALSVQKNMLISGSCSSDGSFCLWNLKNNTMLEQGINQPGFASCITNAVFLDPFDMWVLADEIGVITIWSIEELPPWLPHKYQCLLRYTHTNRKQKPSSSAVVNLSTLKEPFFLTEAHNSDTPTEKAHFIEKMDQKDEEVLPVRSLQWLPKENFLVIGDEKGAITLLKFVDLLEKIKEYRSDVEAQVAQMDKAANIWSMDDLLQVEKSWNAHSNSSICNLYHCDIENQSVLVSSSESGQVFLWNLKGEKLGRLDNEALTGQAAIMTPWKLQLSLEDIKKPFQKEATEILQKMTVKKSVEEVREPIEVSMNLDPISLPKTRGYEFKIGINPQEALVEWRSKLKQQVPIAARNIPRPPSNQQGERSSTSRMISNLFKRQLN